MARSTGPPPPPPVASTSASASASATMPAVATLGDTATTSLAVARRDSSAPLAKHAVAPAPRDGVNKAVKQAIPAFLTKLFTMVNDPEVDDLIHWSRSGDAFVVVSSVRFGKDLLPLFFKHANFGSFVRQLNMYGFHKVPHLNQGSMKGDYSETEMLEFANEHFLRDQPDLLCLITRKKAAAEQPHHLNVASSSVSTNGTTSTSNLELQRLLTDLTAIRKHQTAISSDLKALQTSNSHLWQEAIASRDRHRKSQETINKILGFLAQVFGGRVLEEGQPETPRSNGGDTERSDGRNTSAPLQRKSDRSPNKKDVRKRVPLLLTNGVDASLTSNMTSEGRIPEAASSGKAKVTQLDDDEVMPSHADERFTALTDSPPSRSQSITPIPPASTSQTSNQGLDSNLGIEDPILSALLAQWSSNPQFVPSTTTLEMEGYRSPQRSALPWSEPSPTTDDSNSMDLVTPSTGLSTIPEPLSLTSHQKGIEDTNSLQAEVQSLQKAIERLVEKLPQQAAITLTTPTVNNASVPDWNSMESTQNTSTFDADAFLNHFIDEGQYSNDQVVQNQSVKSNPNLGLSPLSTFLSSYDNPNNEGTKQSGNGTTDLVHDLDFDSLWNTQPTLPTTTTSTNTTFTNHQNHNDVVVPLDLNVGVVEGNKVVLDDVQMNKGVEEIQQGSQRVSKKRRISD